MLHDTQDPSANVELALVAPPPITPGVCATCRNLIARGYRECFRCSRQPTHLDAFAPIALSLGGSDWHRALRGYKDAASAETRSALAQLLADVFDGYVRQHEPCVARAAEATQFDMVTTIPSKRQERDAPAAIATAAPHTPTDTTRSSRACRARGRRTATTRRRSARRRT